jgi:Amt family ammonium transporter
MVGMLLTAVFAEDVGLIYGEFTTLGIHFLCLVIVGSFAFVGSLALYWITDQLITLRVSPEEEHDGLDISQHGEFFGESPAPLVSGQREK